MSLGAPSPRQHPLALIFILVLQLLCGSADVTHDSSSVDAYLTEAKVPPALARPLLLIYEFWTFTFRLSLFLEPFQEHLQDAHYTDLIMLLQKTNRGKLSPDRAYDLCKRSGPLLHLVLSVYCGCLQQIYNHPRLLPSITHDCACACFRKAQALRRFAEWARVAGWLSIHSTR
eukprot:SAG31_NODE_820_length_11808_cov_16.331540_12_plen_173_part_00